MSELLVFAERVIGAPAATVYSCLADYKQHHPNILPPAFSPLTVEAGGVGAGTVISFRIRAGGRERAYRMRVSEPEPRRVLAETDLNSSLVTTFTVTSQSAGSLVRIETRWQGAGGFGGLVERLFAPPVMRRLYADELTRLDAYARRLSG